MASSGSSFRGLWLATGLANLGDGLYLVALPLVAVGLTDSPAAVAGVTVMLTAAWPVFGLHAGGIVDRSDRRRLMVVVNLARATALAALTVALAADSASIALVYAVALLLGVGETLVDTAQAAIVPSVVPAADLGRANARIEATQNVANQLIGPPLGGLVAAAGLAYVTGLSAATYAATLAGLALVRVAVRPQVAGAATVVANEDPGSGPERRDAAALAGPGQGDGGVLAGLVFMARHRLLRTVTLMTALMNVWWAAWTAVLVVYAVSPGPMGLSESGYGLLLTAMAVGGLAGALLAEPARRRFGARRVLVLDVVGTAAMVGTPALTDRVWPVAVAIVVGGAGSAVWRVIGASIRQLTVPDALLGRVYSASRVVSWGVLPLGAGLAGLLAEAYGVRSVFVAGGVTSLGLVAVFVAAVRPGDLAALGLGRAMGPARPDGGDGAAGEPTVAGVPGSLRPPGERASSGAAATVGSVAAPNGEQGD